MSSVLRCAGRLVGGSGVVVGEVGGEVAVGVGLGEEGLGLGLEDADGVGAGRIARRGLVEGGEVDKGSGELGRLAALLFRSCSANRRWWLGTFGVVLDRGCGELRRLRREELGAEESGHDQHGPDAERGNLGGQGSMKPSTPKFAAA